jgi:DNA-binding transcriptional regulator LsrR (DeoR family)
VITVEDWAEIRRLYRSEKLSQVAIARQLGLSRNTVAKALRSESATVIAERVGWTGGHSWFGERT